jgi:hypothetical protein
MEEYKGYIANSQIEYQIVKVETSVLRVRILLNDYFNAVIKSEFPELMGFEDFCFIIRNSKGEIVGDWSFKDFDSEFNFVQPTPTNIRS